MKQRAIIEHQPEDHKIIPCKDGEMALCSNEDFEILSQHSWYVGPFGYPFTRFGGKLHKMHYLVLGKRVDHRNRNPLDNRRENLRIATHSQNGANKAKQKGNYSSRFKGVSMRPAGYWHAYAFKNRKRMHLGYFTEEELAARAYDRAAMQLHGEFAVLNFPASSVAS